MNALQPSQPQLKLVETHQANRRPRSQRRHRPHKAMVIEATAKISANIVICATAICALTQLLPYSWSQQQKLNEIRQEKNLVEKRVKQLNTDFSRYFDPRQANRIMQEQSQRNMPGERPVVLLNQTASAK